MKTPAKIAIILVVAAAAIAAFILKKNTASGLAGSGPARSQTSVIPSMTAKLPKLIDLGADKCIPCKAMAPILEQLKKEYEGRMTVEFIDVWKNPGAGEQYKIEMIPTQIFYDGSGKELFRHVGFFGKEDILGKWKELGVDLSESNSKGPPLR